MIIEIQKAYFNNKGAELMQRAIRDKLLQEFPNSKIVLAPHAERAPYIERAKLGYYQKSWYYRFGIQWGYLGILIPKYFRDLFGILLDKEIDVILDASGFSYTDQLGAGNLRRVAIESRNWRDKKFILMPQAFGPFTSNKSKKRIKKIIERADLVFVRDRISYNYLKEIVGDKPNIKQAPDFTNLLPGIVPSGYNSLDKEICLIPNKRMLNRTSSQVGSSYITFMVQIANYLIDQDSNPFLLLHSVVEDKKLVSKIQEQLKERIPVVYENDSLKIKGIISTCRGVISSRFHGLVSALSQGIPALGTSWSHKYKMLFEDYSFPEGILDTTLDSHQLLKNVDLLINKETNEELREKLSNKAKYQKLLSEKMWEDVISLIKE